MALRPCKECGNEISTDAKICPHCGKRTGMSKSSGCLLIFALIILVLIILAKIADVGNEPSTSHQTPITQPSDDAALLLSRCGKPDADDSTAYDNPRPPIPTRWLEYRKAHVKALFIPSGATDAPPPYQWKSIGATDPRTRKPLSPEEAFKRLPCWRSK